MNAETPGYQTVYLDVSTITGEVTRLDLLLRANSALTDVAGTKLFFDEIEFLTFTPATTMNGFIKNPGFEDDLSSLTPWKINIFNDSSTLAYAQTSFIHDAENVRTGEGSFKIEYLDTAGATLGNVFIFSDDTVGVAPGAPDVVYGAGSVIESKCWIKTSVGTPQFDMLHRYALRNDGAQINRDGVATIPAGDHTWNEITFTYTLSGSEAFKTIGIWPGILADQNLGYDSNIYIYG